jgi:hypothetical protein
MAVRPSEHPPAHALRQKVCQSHDVHGSASPEQHETEIRCYIRDPDGHLIEVGQTTRAPHADTNP